MRAPIAVVFSIGLILNACDKAGKNEQTAEARPPIDACSLITKEEIEPVQGSPVTDTKGSANVDGGLRTAQCFYTTAQIDKSVSFLVTQRDANAPGKRGPKEFWAETFGSYREADAKEREGDKEKKESLREQAGARHEEEEAAPPKRIKGIGDDAFWTGSSVGGALYVLQKDIYIRVSVGGPDTEEAKIDKTKALAEKALKRLQAN